MTRRFSKLCPSVYSLPQFQKGIVGIKGSVRTSPNKCLGAFRAEEVKYIIGWYNSITMDIGDSNPALQFIRFGSDHGNYGLTGRAT